MKMVLKSTLLRHVIIGTLSLSAFSFTATSPAISQSYTWQVATIGGGGYVPAIVAHPSQQGLFYARTDVGGAYRYDSTNMKWIPLLDSLSLAQRNYDNIQAIALDPNNANMLYMVAGGGGDWNVTCCGAVLVSNNKGASFTIVPLSFQANGNEAGRQVGERLQVDPNLGSVLFYGTANNSSSAPTNGLWKSTNGASSWSHVTSFPAMSNDGTGAGIAFIAFHKPSSASGQATKTIFVGVNTQTAANSGTTLYESTNGGSTWSLVSGAPSGAMPQRGQIGPDGNLYITYSNGGQGPAGLANGQVWKYNISAKSWTNITPTNDSVQLSGWNSNYGFAGLSVDPAHSGVVAVMTINRYDNYGESMFRTTNGGQSWVNVSAKVSIDMSQAPWAAPRTSLGNWSGVALDPFDVNHAFTTWGLGVMSTNNLTASASNQTVNFKADQSGIEESVANGLISPNTFSWGGSVPVVSAMGDMCGFYHASVTQSPSKTFATGCPQGSTWDIDWAKSVPNIVVRVGEGGGFPGALSYDGGNSWTQFPATPSGVTTGGAGHVAINADGSAIIWSPGDANIAPVLSTTSAYSWTSLPLPAGSNLAADGLTSTNLYAYDKTTGKFYSSTDKGATWTNSATINSWQNHIVAPFGKSCDIWLYGLGGVWHNTGCGWGTWNQVSGATDVQGLGFGKAASGQSYPAIYMGGKMNGTSGMFRSVDGGYTWVKINDNAHQYGGFRIVTGDPKTFGTVYSASNAARGIIVGTSPN